MSAPRHIAVLDIGKTNVKLALIDRQTLAEIDLMILPNHVLLGPPWPHFDTEGIWAFLLEGLKTLHGRHGVDAIVPVAHGACAALLAGDGSLAAPALDYEHPGPEDLADAYDTIRPPFTETGSPRLSLGLNLGAQLHWQLSTDPGLVTRLATVVTWPQYWSYRLTGVAATDASSLGAHSDLWNPARADFSPLVARLGLSNRIARPRPPGEILGPIRADVAAATGLDPATPIACGIHDSNASLLPYLLGRKPPFTVVSTGTWVITMAVGAPVVPLDEARDTLINVSALGQPVPSARFMGGREYALLGGGRAEAGVQEMEAALRAPFLLLPAVDPLNGPFRGRAMAWSPQEPDDPGVREAALSFYLGLMTAECLAITGAAGPVIVEGPFAANPLCLEMLGAATCRPVLTSGSRTGTGSGAALLFDGGRGPVPLALEPVSVAPERAGRLAAYAERWRSQCAATPEPPPARMK